jgi:hypothetical protein
VPLDYNIIVGRETAVPCPLYHSDPIGFDMISFPVASELYSFLQPEERYRSYHTDATGFDMTPNS